MESTNEQAKQVRGVTMEELDAAFRQSRLKFTRPGGMGLLCALDKPAVRKGLELQARVMRDLLRAAPQQPSEPPPAQVAMPSGLTGRQLFEAYRDMQLQRNAA